MVGSDPSVRRRINRRPTRMLRRTVAVRFEVEPNSRQPAGPRATQSAHQLRARGAARDMGGGAGRGRWGIPERDAPPNAVHGPAARPPAARTSRIGTMPAAQKPQKGVRSPARQHQDDSARFCTGRALAVDESAVADDLERHRRHSMVSQRGTIAPYSFCSSTTRVPLGCCLMSAVLIRFFMSRIPRPRFGSSVG